MIKSVSLTFAPADNLAGTVTLNYDIYTQENDATNIAKGSGSIVFDVQPVADGLDLAGLTVSGTEFTDNTGTEYIELRTTSGSIDGADLIDSDGSEVIQSLILDGVPDGFLVYFGDASSRAIAQNSGDNGSGSTFDLSGVAVGYNAWNVPVTGSGTAPKIWIKAPQDWSGEVTNINFITVVKDGGALLTKTTSFDLQVTAVASSVTINPTQMLESAYNWASVNLNANMTDLDGSETLTISLTAASGYDELDSSALFRLSDGSIPIDDTIVGLDASYDGVTNTWTITGVPSDQINNIEMLYHDHDGVVDVSVVTVDGSSVLASPVTDSFNLAISVENTIDLSSETRDLNIRASDFATTITGGSGNDSIIGGAGDDDIFWRLR